MRGLDSTNKKVLQANLQLEETYELVKRTREELERLKQITDEILIKAQVSHCMLVIRKIDETKVKELSALLD